MRWASAVAATVMILNLASFTFPEIPRSRWQVVEAIRSLPEGEKVAAMPCLYPVLERRTDKALIWPRKTHDAAYEVLRSSVTTRPFTPREVEDRIERRLASGQWDRRFEHDGFVILEGRRVKGEETVGAGTRRSTRCAALAYRRPMPPP